MKTMTCIGTAATLVFIAASAAAAPFSRHEVSGATITQIADLGGAQSMALDINDDGYIAGWSELPTGERHALYNIGGVLAFDLSHMYNLGRSEARGINNSKHVVGSMIDASGRGRAFRWYGGWVDILDDQDPSAIDQQPKLSNAAWGNCRALALNERRAYDGIVQVVGCCESSPGVARAVRWDVTVASVSILPPQQFP